MDWWKNWMVSKITRCEYSRFLQIWSPASLFRRTSRIRKASMLRNSEEVKKTTKDYTKLLSVFHKKEKTSKILYFVLTKQTKWNDNQNYPHIYLKRLNLYTATHHRKWHVGQSLLDDFHQFLHMRFSMLKYQQEKIVRLKKKTQNKVSGAAKKQINLYNL